MGLSIVALAADTPDMDPYCPDPLVRATLTAVHRRDHRHEPAAAATSLPHADACHPHDIEIVHLGRSAMAVCHDCCFEFGLDDAHSCEQEAQQHRRATA